MAHSVIGDENLYMWKPRVIRTISASNSSIFSYVIRPGASSGRQAKLDIVWCGYEEWFQSSLFTSRAHLTMIIQYSLSRSHSIWGHYLREYVLIGAVSFYLYRMAFNISCFSNSSVKFFFVITNAIYSDTDIRENWKKILPQEFALHNNSQPKFSIIDCFISLHTHPISLRRSKVHLIRNRIYFITNFFGEHKAVVFCDAHINIVWLPFVWWDWVWALLWG